MRNLLSIQSWVAYGHVGDASAVFAHPGIPEFIKEHAVAVADVITPDQFELEFLAARPIRTLDDLHAALDAAHALGPQVVLATSVHLEDTPVAAQDEAVTPSTRFAVERLGA